MTSPDKNNPQVMPQAEQQEDELSLATESLFSRSISTEEFRDTSYDSQVSSAIVAMRDLTSIGTQFITGRDGTVWESLSSEEIGYIKEFTASIRQTRDELVPQVLNERGLTASTQYDEQIEFLSKRVKEYREAKYAELAIAA